MNRELRRLQEKEEKRARDRRSKGQATRPKRKRVGIRQFLSEVRTELKRVAWPSRQETVTFTVVTLITSVSVTLLRIRPRHRLQEDRPPIGGADRMNPSEIEVNADAPVEGAPEHPRRRWRRPSPLPRQSKKQ